MIAEITPAAFEEGSRVIAYYDRLDPALGVAFRASLSSALDRLERFPEAGTRTERGLRWVRLDRFPYRVVYRVLPSTIIVVAIPHHRQDTMSWQGR